MKQYQGKVVVFCMPGNSYSGRFLTSFVELIDACRSIGIRPLISQDYSSMVNLQDVRWQVQMSLEENNKHHLVEKLHTII